MKVLKEVALLLPNLKAFLSIPWWSSKPFAFKDAPNIVIVGGGVGGLAIASRLKASMHCNVTILEKNDFVGGRCGSFYVDLPEGTFRHERGPSLLLLPQVYRELFSDCGFKAEDFGLEIVRCIPAYQAVFDDGDVVEVGFPQTKPMTERELRANRKMDTFEPNGATKSAEYLDVCEAFLDCGLPNFIEERLDLRSFPAFIRASLKNGARAWPLKPHSDVLDVCFASDKMRALASFQDLYVGLSPYRNGTTLSGGILEGVAPAVFGLLSAIELHPSNTKCGVFAPIGGFQRVTNSFENLGNRLGVDMKTGQTVTKVTSEGVFYHCNGEAAGSKFMAADLIIVNADLPFATESLLPEGKCADSVVYDWTEKLQGHLPFRFSSGVIAFHWSLDKSIDALTTHNVFLSTKTRDQAERSWQVSSGRAENCVDDNVFNFYVHRPSFSDPSSGPQDCDSLMVLVPCPTLAKIPEASSLPRSEAMRLYGKQFDQGAIDNVRQAVLKRMKLVDSDIASHIIHEVVDTPVTYAIDYNVAAGTPFGLSHGLAQLSIARPGPFSSSHPNIVFVGASSRPGNGVPLVLTGAKLVAQKVFGLLRSREDV